MKQQSSKWQSIKGKARYFDYRLSIRTKLTLILIFIPLVILPFVAVSLHYNNLSYNTIQGLRRFTEIARVCETISFLTLKIDSNVKNYIVLRDSNNINEIKENLASLKELADDGKEFGYSEEFIKIISYIDRYSTLIDSLKIVISLEEIPHKRIARDLEKYTKGYDNLMSKVLLARSSTERDSLMKELKVFSQSFDVSQIIPEREQNPEITRTVKLLNTNKRNIDSQNGAILDKAKGHIKEFTELGEKAASKGARNIWVVLIITVSFLIYLIIVLPERIVIPIKRLSNIVKQIEKGDLNVAIKGFPRDEIGELVYYLSRMLNQIRKIDGLKTQKILESERKFKFLTNSIKEGVIVLNDELRLLFINKSALMIIGSDTEQIKEKSLGGIESLKFIKSKIDKLFINGEKIGDIDFSGKDSVQYIIKVWPIRNAAGKPTGAILLFTS